MAVTPLNDKIVIQALLTTDSYLIDYLEFSPDEIYRVKATDEILGTHDSKNRGSDGLKQQIFIYNAYPEATINPVIHGIVYEIDVSVPFAKSGTADLAMEQIIAILDGKEIANTHELEILDMPVVLSSETSLYQVGCRFVCYVSKYNKKKIYVKEESEDTENG